MTQLQNISGPASRAALAVESSPPAKRPLRDKSSDPRWLLTPEGSPRGYIETASLAELWFHTGTACNLSCPSCLEGSKPGDRRIEFLTLEDVKPYIAEALELGVERFSFTGGEPFVNRWFVAILDYALDHRPCFVLTNGTRPLRKRLPEIVKLKRKPNPLAFRVSLDYPDPARHDQSRGQGNFRMALGSASLLHAEGFAVAIARLMTPTRIPPPWIAATHRFFSKPGCPRTCRS